MKIQHRMPAIAFIDLPDLQRQTYNEQMAQCKHLVTYDRQ